jgi:hypothetical protein
MADPTLLASYEPDHGWHLGQLVASMRNFANPDGVCKDARFGTNYVASSRWMSDPEFSKHINIKLNNKTSVKYVHGWDGVVAVAKRLEKFVNPGALCTSRCL